MLIVYHGSTSRVESPLAGVCRANLDFGIGFYVTNLRSQAERWALRVAGLRNTPDAILNVYHLDNEAVDAMDYRRLNFTSYDAAWLDFVAACRRGYDLWKEYDWIEGGVADDRVVRTVDLYLRGDYTREEALVRLAHQEPNNQICIVSQEIINRHLVFVEAIHLPTNKVDISLSGRPDADPVLQAKYLGIVERLALVLHLSSEQALDVFYNSDTYRYLSTGQGGLHLMSDAFLADEVIFELQRKQGS